MMKKIVFLLAALCCGLHLYGKDASWHYDVKGNILTVTLQIPRAVYYYREETAVSIKTGSGTELSPKEEPLFRVQADSISGESVQIYAGPGNKRWVFSAEKEAYPLKVSLKWQGCADGSDGKAAACFMPGEKTEILNLSGNKLIRGSARMRQSSSFLPQSGSGIGTEQQDLVLPEFTLVRSDSGYLPVREFLAFLKGERKDSFAELGKKSFLFMMLLIFLGGIALNLTPCVLPMIPVNLAIIGGSSSSSRKSCIFHGLTYGAGMALAYGITGIAVVLTQSTLGALDSTWYFNGITSVIFFVLGLSMFDVFMLDFSKYQGGVFRHISSARYAGVFIMGGLTALLAGACVAPVVVAVLIQSGKMYNSGETWGLFLPLVLGLGMALPWPLASAGLTVLPKPGKWMKYVKYVLGILIIFLGIYYAVLAFQIFLQERENFSKEKGYASYTKLVKALQESSRTGKEVFVDFTAQWCKNCKTMEKNVFPDPAVRRELENFIFVKVDASDVKDPLIESILNKFDVKGLPSYRIIRGK